MINFQKEEDKTMKKRFKTVVTTAMVAALTASLLTGCGSSTDDTTASAPETGEASDTAEASGGSDGDSILHPIQIGQTFHSR